MGDQVELVNISQTEHFQSNENFQDNVVNTKLSEFHEASRKRDKLILAFIIVQLFCVLLAVAVNFVYLNDNIEKSVGLQKQIQQCTIYTSKLTSLDKQDDYGMRDLFKGYSGNSGIDSNPGNTGEKGEKGKKEPKGKKGPMGNKGEKGTIGDKGQNGPKGIEADKGTADAKGTEGQNGSKGEMGSPGVIGSTGNKGENGAKGFTGVKGPNGQPGLKGAHGQKGDMGTTGQTGSNGDNGKKDSQRKGGYLVKIEDIVENWFLKSLINGGSVWIGAHDSTRESRFTWVSDNTPVTFTDWMTNQPDNWRNGEDCVHFLSGSNKWNDAECSHKMGYICEKH